MQSFKAPTSADLFPPNQYRPDKNHLAEVAANPFFREFLSRVHQRLFSHRERLSSEKTEDSFDVRKGRISGIEEVLEVLETVKSDVETK